MTTQRLLYTQTVPLTTARHLDLSVKTGTDYGFARGVNAVPATVAELVHAALEYAILFAGDEAVSPIVLLGARNGENLFVGPTGAWTGRYVPTFLRRYPFVLAKGQDERTLTLCIDEAFAGCNREGRGERLFDAEGERTAYLKQMLGFNQAVHAEQQRTKAFCATLVELGLLQPVKATLTGASGEQRVIDGVKAVDRGRLKALPAERLAALMADDSLEAIYLHLASLGNLRSLGERMSTAVVEGEARGDAPGTSTRH